MNEREILRALTKLDVDYRHTEGDWCMCACPLAPYRIEHPKGTDNKPGFGIHIEDEDISYGHCFTCKWKGTLGGLAMQLAKYREEPELLRYGKELDRQEILGGGTDYEWEENDNAKSKAPPRNTNFPSEAEFERRYPSVLSIPAAVAYLGRRRISLGTVVGLGLRYDPKQRRILFPVYDYWTGRYAGCSGRSVLGADQLSREEDRTGKPQPKVRDYQGLQKDRVLLGGRAGSVSKRALVNTGQSMGSPTGISTSPQYLVGIEGLFAFARSWQHGWRSNAFALLGSECLPGKAAIIADINLPVFWFTDNDPAGQACLYGRWDQEAESHKGNGALDMLYHDVAQFVPTWPEGKDDPDDLTKQEFDLMIEEAELYAKLD